MSAAPRIDVSVARWRKSSYSNHDGGNCVEVADNVPNTVPVRDSKSPARTPLAFTPHAWASFVAGVRSGALTA
ncbi:DUF397 domain-containing protein [Streptomyces sp. MUM 203J]|uniref:DUF397 domain-containing protein n=1 Tax=Streptomyces sp. MUM 203J TaxID=2791990 RepID=UPI001F044A18|nr:DUF397 domain-containing protein [Streptomyces sp. MUM 203J]MCH0542354.1 DUF397 domain-containing protein [Streptomyces sp. MUM 203J]